MEERVQGCGKYNEGKYGNIYPPPAAHTLRSFSPNTLQYKYEQRGGRKQTKNYFFKQYSHGQAMRIGISIIYFLYYSIYYLFIYCLYIYYLVRQNLDRFKRFGGFVDYSTQVIILIRLSKKYSNNKRLGGPVVSVPSTTYAHPGIESRPVAQWNHVQLF